MADILKKIIDHLNNGNLSEAFNLCENNNNNKIEHLILNIKFWWILSNFVILAKNYKPK